MARKQTAKEIRAEAQKKGRAALQRVRGVAADQQNRDVVASIAGGAAAGGLRGAGMEISAGGVDVGWGAPAGLALVLMGKRIHSQAQAAGGGMLAYEIGSYVEEMVSAALLDESPDPLSP